MNKQQLIEALELETHMEGGYFRRTYAADQHPRIDTEAGPRLRLSSIFYLLTDDSPIGHWHLNRSDILHFFHSGKPITYYLMDAERGLQTVILGPDPSLGHQLQLLVPGGTWKASHLEEGEYGLISEAVCPGFEYQDMALGEQSQLLSQFPQYQEQIMKFFIVS